VFLGTLTVQENMGRGSPPPTYKYEDNVKYRDVRSKMSNHTLLLLVLKVHVRPIGSPADGEAQV
jgi:hypothetical protein